MSKAHKCLYEGLVSAVVLLILQCVQYVAVNMAEVNLSSWTKLTITFHDHGFLLLQFGRAMV